MKASSAPQQARIVRSLQREQGEGHVRPGITALLELCIHSSAREEHFRVFKGTERRKTVIFASPDSSVPTKTLRKVSSFLVAQGSTVRQGCKMNSLRITLERSRPSTSDFHSCFLDSTCAQN